MVIFLTKYRKLNWDVYFYDLSSLKSVSCQHYIWIIAIVTLSGGLFAKIRLRINSVCRLNKNVFKKLIKRTNGRIKAVVKNKRASLWTIIVFYTFKIFWLCTKRLFVLFDLSEINLKRRYLGLGDIPLPLSSESIAFPNDTLTDKRFTPD